MFVGMIMMWFMENLLELYAYPLGTCLRLRIVGWVLQIGSKCITLFNYTNTQIWDCFDSSSILYKIILKKKKVGIALQVLVVVLQAVVRFIMKYFVETGDKIHADEVYCHSSNGVLSSDPNDSGVNAFINEYGILEFFGTAHFSNHSVILYILAFYTEKGKIGHVRLTSFISSWSVFGKRVVWGLWYAACIHLIITT